MVSALRKVICILGLVVSVAQPVYALDLSNEAESKNISVAGSVCISLEEQLKSNADIVSGIAVLSREDSMKIWEKYFKSLNIPELSSYIVVSLKDYPSGYGLAGFDNKGCLIPGTVVSIRAEQLKKNFDAIGVVFPEMVPVGTSI